MKNLLFIATTLISATTLCNAEKLTENVQVLTTAFGLGLCGIVGLGVVIVLCGAKAR